MHKRDVVILSGAGLSYACRFFFDSELPQARCWLSIVESQSKLARTMTDEAFG